MNMWAKLAIVFGIFIFIVTGSIGVTFYSTYNSFVDLEEDIRATFDNNKNSYDNFYKKVLETSKVPSKYSEDLRKVYDSALTARYGSQGSQAVMNWIKENNPNFDASLYKKLQQVIDSGRTDFTANQTTLLDKKKLYKQKLRRFPNNLIAGTMGFPKLDLDKMKIITSDRTEEAFETGKDTEINF